MNDRIEREITIEAGLERVWELVTRPGWWVPDEASGAGGNAGGNVGEPDRTPGSRTVRESEKWGRYVVEVVAIEPMHYAAFRWASEFPGEEPTDGNSTLVEFFVKPAGDGQVIVSLVESGFGKLPPDRRENAHQANTNGWQEELASLARQASSR
jgi:uncharacterized protein YndB with AHSA1/START domain